MPAMLGPVTQPDARRRPSRRPAGASPRAEHAIVLDEGAGLGRLQRLLDDGMAAAADLEGLAVVDDGPRVASRRAPARRAPPSHRARRARRRLRRAPARSRCDRRRQLGEDLLLEAQRALGGRRDAPLDLDQLRGREAHGVRHRLPVAEARRQRRAPAAAWRCPASPR